MIRSASVPANVALEGKFILRPKVIINQMDSKDFQLVAALYQDARLKADTLSLAAFKIGLFGWMAIVVLVIFGTT